MKQAAAMQLSREQWCRLHTWIPSYTPYNHWKRFRMTIQPLKNVQNYFISLYLYKCVHIFYSFFFILTHLSRDCCLSVNESPAVTDVIDIQSISCCLQYIYIWMTDHQSFMISLICGCWTLDALLSLMVVLVSFVVLS